VQDATVERYVVAAQLAPGAAREAEELLSAGPPFDPGEAGLSAHAAYLADDAVFLVFEGDAAHAKALRLANEYVVDVGRWQRIISGLPSAVPDVPAGARCLYRWSAEGSA
jgi:hypothetical protein